MTPTTAEAKKIETGFEDSAERVKEFNERLLTTTKNVGNVTLDTYETTARTFADYTEKIGAVTPIEWVSTLTQAQADLTRDLTSAYTKAARTLLA